MTRLSLPLLGRALAISCATLACASEPRRTAPAGDANAGVDSLNARIAKAYRDRDPVAYGRQFADSAVFEWPAFETVRGRAGIEAMARVNWAPLSDMDLELDVAQRRVAADHVTEFGAFQQAYTDSGGKHVEYGRYVALLVPGADGWRMDRFFGFSDSTAKR
jgi:ketosteroid isomerase-like protein